MGDSTAPVRISCVIVNWNGWLDTVACLDSLRTQDYPALEVIVVDNGSTNGSAARIRAAHPWVTLIESPTNLGFPGGCNVGTRLAYQRGADLVWLLNNDTIAPPNTASAIVLTALQHPDAGAIGCVLYYMHDPTRVQAWGGGRINLASAFVQHFHGPASFADESTFFTGASLTVPRRVLETVGIFYEGLFMYCDDADYCIRLHRAGLKLVMAEDTAILHKEGASSPKRSPVIDQYAVTSTLRLLQRAAAVPVFSMLIYLTLRIANRIVRREWKNIAGVLRGVKIYLVERNRVFTDQL